MYSIRTKETRGLLAVIMAFVMVFAGAAFVAVEVDADGDEPALTEYVLFNGVKYSSLDEAMGAAAIVVEKTPAATYTFEIYGNMEWVTGAQHGSTPFMTTDTKDTIIQITGMDKEATITATGNGVGPIGIDNGIVIYNNLAISDESLSYAENAWEFAYLEFRGNAEFNKVTFNDPISVDAVTVEFNDCVFKGKTVGYNAEDSTSKVAGETKMYGVWVSGGTVSFDSCDFTGTRGLKVHECYGTDVIEVKVNNCKFNLSEKPGIVFGDIYKSGDTYTYKVDGVPHSITYESDTKISISGCEVIGTKQGDQKYYFMESDTAIIDSKGKVVSWLTLESNYVIIKDGMTLEDVILLDGVDIILEEGASFKGTVTSGTDELSGEFKAGSGGVTLSVGSIKIDGVVQEITENTSKITVSGDVEISGTIGVDIIVDNTKETTITVPAEGVELVGDMTFGTGSENVEIVAVGDVSGSGTIKNKTADGESTITITKSSGSNITVNMEKDVELTVDDIKDNLPATDGGKTIIDSIDDVNAFQNLMNNNTLVNAEGDIVVKEGFTIEVPAHATLNMGEFNIKIGDAPTGTTSGAAEMVVYGHIIGTGVINVYGSLYLESADVRMSVDIHDDEGEEGYVSISKPKKMTVTGNQTADLGVGYGNTLVLKDLDVPSGKYIKAWGTVIIEGTVTVEDSNGFIVYYGGNAQIDGALVIEGGATVNGTAVVNGSVKVYNSEGGASFNVGANGVVDVVGTMDVLKGKTKNTTNTLAVAAGGDLNVEGTLTVTGTMSGMVCDMGTVVFNGAASGADTGFTVYDGVTLTIASVTGTLKITDLNIQDEDYTGPNYVTSTGNVVSISNVKNVTVSVVLDETNVKVGADSKRLVTSEMTVTGTITSIDEETTTVVEKVEVTGTDVKSTVNNETVQGSIVLGDITLGKQVVLDIKSGDVDINGTVNAVAEKSSIIIGDDAVDVNGTILVGEKAVAATVLNINGATYYIDDDTKTDDKVTYYTTFENALAAIATANEKTIEILGTVEVATELEIPAEATVLVKGALTIDVDGKITVAAGALFDADNATENVDVDGMLVIMDKESGLEGDNKLVYQVYTEAGDVATYSGLVLALRNATEGDVITVVKAGEIEKSVTIPEGVTLVVPNGSTLTIGSEKDDVTLTVAGTLKVEGTVEAADTSKKVEIAVPGTIMEIGSGDIKFDDATTTDVDGIVMDDYVTFNMKVDGRATVVYSNLAYAAENAIEGDIIVFGDVSAGDITFTMGEKATEFDIGFGKTGSTMTVGTMTLVSNGKADITLDTKAISGEVTGTVASAAGSVDLNKVSGITIAVSIVTDVDGSTDYMTVDETLAGSMTVATGTVTVDELSVGSTEKNVLTIDTGATLVVPNGKKLTVSAMSLTTTGVTQYYGLIVDGTLAIEGGSLDDTANGTGVKASEIIVNGTMTVSKKDVTMEGKLFVNGTLSVISTDEEKAKLTVNGIIVLGTAPALGANGVLSGPISVADSNVAYIVAYAGADVSAALLNVNDSTGESDIDFTEIVINGVLYMTVYVYDADLISLKDLEDAKYFKTDGFENDVAWASPAEDTTKVGVFDKVEGTMLAAKTKLTVSAGVGLKVYIDGLAIENFKEDYSNKGEGYWIQFGTHTVSFAVESGYDGANATITVNGVAVSNNGTFTVDVDDKDVVIIASGAVPAQSGSTVVVDEDDGMKLTDILLIVLVVLIVIMAIIVALRMMRS